MHLLAFNTELRSPVRRQFIRENPSVIPTTAFRSSSHPLIQSNHISWVVDIDDEYSEVELGRLRGYIARQNPQAKAIIESLASESSAVSLSSKTHLKENVLVLFDSPIHHYLTSKFYTEMKSTSDKVVPTWDYEVVEVYGTARIYFGSSFG